MKSKKKKEVDGIDIRIFYLCVHKRLNDRVDRSRVMNKKDFNDILGRVYHLPKKLWPCVLKEMEEMEMIEDLGCKRNNNAEIGIGIECPTCGMWYPNSKTGNIKVNGMFKDPEEDANEFYQKLGIF